MVDRFAFPVPVATAPVSVDDVRRVYATAAGVVIALDGVSLDAPAGALTVVAGRSGCGKSTLLRIVAAIDRPDGGSVMVDGIDVGDASRRSRRALRRRRIGFVFAKPTENLLPGLDALANIRLAQRLRGDPSDGREWMARVGLAGHEHARVAELSGGEQQRLAFAIAAVGRPAVVVADEPTAELDAATTVEVVRVLRDLTDDGVTFLVASHDQQVIAQGDIVVRLEDGRRIA